MNSDMTLAQRESEVYRLIGELDAGLNRSRACEGFGVGPGYSQHAMPGYAHLPRDNDYGNRLPAYSPRGSDSGSVSATVKQLEEHATWLGRLRDQQSGNLEDFHDRRRDVKGHSAAIHVREGEAACNSEIDTCQRLLRHIAAALTRANWTAERAPQTSGTQHTGIAALVGSPSKPPRPYGPSYDPPSVLDETLHRVDREQGSAPESNAEPSTPYLGKYSKRRDASLDDKVRMGGARLVPPRFEPCPPPASHGTPPPPGVHGEVPYLGPGYPPLDPNDPTQKANYDRQKGRVYY